MNLYFLPSIRIFILNIIRIPIIHSVQPMLGLWADITLIKSVINSHNTENNGRLPLYNSNNSHYQVECKIKTMFDVWSFRYQSLVRIQSITSKNVDESYFSCTIIKALRLDVQKYNLDHLELFDWGWYKFPRHNHVNSNAKLEHLYNNSNDRHCSCLLIFSFIAHFILLCKHHYNTYSLWLWCKINLYQ